MKFILGFSLFLVAQVCLADIPHSFTPGTPASASEVNENFSSLDERVDDLESSSNQGPDSSETSHSYPAYTLHTIAEEITYTPKANISVGQEVRIGDKDFRIYRFPVKSLTDDSLYGLTLPISGEYHRINTSSNINECWGLSDALDNNKTLLIGGYEVLLRITWKREYDLQNRQDYRSKFDVGVESTISLCIKLDQYTFVDYWINDFVDRNEYTLCYDESNSFRSDDEGCQENTDGFTKETYDLVLDQYNSMYSNQVSYDEKEALDDFIDHVSIERIE